MWRQVHDCFRRLHAASTAELDEFGHIDAPAAGLVAGHPPLTPPQPFGQLSLRQAGGLAYAAMRRRFTCPIAWRQSYAAPIPSFAGQATAAPVGRAIGSAWPVHARGSALHARQIQTNSTRSTRRWPVSMRLRETARRNQPWRFSTGPRTAEGKARAAHNGRARQMGPHSVRQQRDMVFDVGAMIAMMAEMRRGVEGG